MSGNRRRPEPRPGAARATAPANRAQSPPPALLWLIVALACVLRLSWAWGDLESLLRYATSDDAYYYFQIARNWVAGAGVTLDGTTTTNGFHPLWLGLLAGVHALASDGELALRLGLSLGALLGAASVALLYYVVARVTDAPWAALWAAAIYALHPTVITESVNGLETSLAVCALAAVTLGYLVLTDANGAAAPRRAVWFGALGGALMLARTDAVFVWAALLLGLVVRTRALKPALLAGAVSTACVLPWLIWNQLSFGSVLQVSAAALPELLRADFLAEHGDALATQLRRSRFLVARAFGSDLPHLYAIPRALPVWPVGLAAAAGALVVLRAPVGRRALLRLLPLIVAVPFTLLWHAGLRWWTREWYFAPAGWLGAVLLGVGVAALLSLAQEFSPGRRRLFVGACAALGGSLLVALAAPPLAAHWRRPSEHRVQQLEAARWIATRTPPDARIGAFNAGIYSYFSGRSVVNLDGVVNADAFEARRAGRLLDYAVAAGVDHLVDWRGTLPMLRCAEHTAVHCEPIAIVGQPLERFAGSPIWIMRVQRVSDGR